MKIALDMMGGDFAPLEAVFKWYGSGEVDFRKNIKLQVKDINLTEGLLQCEFIKEKRISLEINYKFFEGLCLAWVVSD